MSIRKKLTLSTQNISGAAKKYFGRVTGNRRLRDEGRLDQATADVKQAGAKITDAFKH